MTPIERLTREEARRLDGLLFDLDDTLLDHGRLTEAAFGSLFRLREAGLRLAAVTGRPAGWGEVLARQWPIDGAVTENGAIAVFSDSGRLRRLDGADGGRAQLRQRLHSIVEALRVRVPELVPTDDVASRLSDYTFDIGEQRRAAPATIENATALARELGARTITSSVHLHVTLDGDDKASGTVRFLRRRFGLDATTCRFRFAYIGDSENDEACFSAFSTTLAVRNFQGRPTVPPRFITRGQRAAGFVEAVNTLLERRS